jgi:hypothetical protein
MICCVDEPKPAFLIFETARALRLVLRCGLLFVGGYGPEAEAAEVVTLHLTIILFTRYASNPRTH